MIQVLALTNGDHDEFADSISSFKKNLRTSLRLEWLVYSASTDEEFREWVVKNFPWVSDIRQGFGRHQLREAWGSINPNADYVIQFNDTQSLSEEFDVDTAIALIDDHPYLAQVVMFDLGIEGSSIKDVRNREWTEHEAGWSTVPSIYRRAITDLGWPIGRVPEDRFTTKLRRNSKSWRFAYPNA